MNKPVQVKIGNENFKTWLKGLNPVTRVERMSAIARTQASAGLRGSLIKASLAQLSQRCQVMLFKLTDKEIKRYTRCRPKKIDEKSHTIKKLYKSKEILNCQKRQEKHRQLFVDTNEVVGLVKDQHSRITSEGQINNYLSTTVNVNIYNSTSKNLICDKASVKRKNCSENNASPHVPTNDQLKINVSLSNGANKVKAKKRKRSKESLRGKTKSSITRNKPIKSTVSFLNFDTNSNEEDTVQELWKIFGMESPIDRSESIIRSYPQVTNKADNSDVASENQNKVGASFERSNDLLFSHSKSQHVVEDMYVKSSGNIVQNGKTSETVLEDNSSEDRVPLCKITETFSLSEGTSSEPPPIENSSSNVQLNSIVDSLNGVKEIETILLSDDEDDRRVESPCKKIVSQVCESDGSNSNKVGTIRVKDLGLLLDPSRASENLPEQKESFSGTSSKQSVHITPPSFLNSRVNAEEKSLEESFSATYSYYCDEHFESKVLKLGELLHLAISDEIRRKERIKRAEQLSSSDLVNQEKIRADKEFFEMMKVRGNEFAPLFQSIVGRFESSSKVTLLIALFLRVFVHAQKIDPVNGDHILSAKKVISVMLSKYNCAENDTSKFLTSDDKGFFTQVEMVRTLLQSHYKGKSMGFEKTILSPNNTSLNINLTLSTDSVPIKAKIDNSLISNYKSVPQYQSPQQSNKTGPSGLHDSALGSDRNIHLQTSQKEPNAHPKVLRNGPPNVTIVKKTPGFIVPSGATSPSLHFLPQLSRCSANKVPLQSSANKTNLNQPTPTTDQQSRVDLVAQTSLIHPTAQPSSISSSQTTPSQYRNRTGMNQVANNFLRDSMPEMGESTNSSTDQTISILNILGAQLHNINTQRQRSLQSKLLVSPMFSPSRPHFPASRPEFQPHMKSSAPLLRGSINSTQLIPTPTSDSSHINVPASPQTSRSNPLLNFNASLTQKHNVAQVYRPEIPNVEYVTNGRNVVDLASQRSVNGIPVSVSHSTSSVVVANPILAQHLLGSKNSISPKSMDKHTSVGSTNIKDQRDMPVTDNSSNFQPTIVRLPQVESYRPTTVSNVVANSLQTIESTSINNSLPQPNLSQQATVESVQGYLPSSSHCHPFIRRMPISGKMRTLFENKN